jgi:uncharacterized hydrophobic protein (TIGR00271 family)
MKNKTSKIKIAQVDLNKGYSDLITSCSFSADYIFMIIMATVLCILGFVMDSETVIIGAMVVSPLLNPIVAFGASIIRRDKKNIFRILKIIIFGLLIAILLSTIISFIWSSDLHQSELISKLQGKEFVYFLVAIISGMVAIWCFYWPKATQAVTGIAIAIALIPPIAILGIGIAANHSIIPMAASIVVLNISGIFLGSMIVLLFLRAYSKKNKDKGIV